MANSLNGTPWVVDTFSPTVPVKQGRVLTTGFTFRDYTGGVASVAHIYDLRRGVEITQLWGNSDGSPVGEAWIDSQWLTDLAINADSGIVTVIVV